MQDRTKITMWDNPHASARLADFLPLVSAYPSLADPLCELILVSTHEHHPLYTGMSQVLRHRPSLPTKTAFDDMEDDSVEGTILRAISGLPIADLTGNVETASLLDRLEELVPHCPSHKILRQFAKLGVALHDCTCTSDHHSGHGIDEEIYEHCMEGACNRIAISWGRECGMWWKRIIPYKTIKDDVSIRKSDLDTMNQVIDGVEEDRIRKTIESCSTSVKDGSFFTHRVCDYEMGMFTPLVDAWCDKLGGSMEELRELWIAHRELRFAVYHDAWDYNGFMPTMDLSATASDPEWDDTITVDGEEN